MPVVVTVPTVLPAGTLKRIHVNRANIVQFHKDKVDRPVYTVKHRGVTYHCRRFHGNVVGVQSLAKPMPGCGARAWLETRGSLTLYAE